MRKILKMTFLQSFLKMVPLGTILKNLQKSPIDIFILKWYFYLLFWKKEIQNCRTMSTDPSRRIKRNQESRLPFPPTLAKVGLKVLPTGMPDQTFEKSWRLIIEGLFILLKTLFVDFWGSKFAICVRSWRKDALTSGQRIFLAKGKERTIPAWNGF